MPRIIPLVLLSLLLVAAGPAPSPASLAISGQAAQPDSLANAVWMKSLLARQGTDPAAIQADLQELLDLYPDRDFALREVSRSLIRLVGPVEAHRLVAAHDLSSLGLRAELGTDAWDLLEANCLSGRSRFRSALDIYEPLAGRRPDWPWLQYYLFTVKSWLLYPDQQLQPHLDRALEFAGPRAETLDLLERQSSLGFAPERHRQVLAAMERPPLDSRGRLYLAIARQGGELGTEPPSAALQEAAWRAFLQEHGELARIHAFDFFRVLPPGVPLADRLALYERLIAEGGQTDDLELLKADLLSDLGETDTVLSILARQREAGSFRGRLELASQANLRRSGELAALLDGIAARDGLQYFSPTQQMLYDQLGRRNDFADLWAAGMVENPLRVLEHRLARAPSAARQQAMALVDSVLSLGNSVVSLDGHAFRLREASGDTMPLQDMVALADREFATFLLRNAAAAAGDRGDSQRLLAVRALQVRHQLGGLGDFTDILVEAWDRSDRPLAEAALRRVQQEIPAGHPWEFFWRLGQTKVFAGPEAAQALARELDPATIGDANLACLLAGVCLSNQWLPEAEALVARGLELAPDAGWTRYQQARLFMARQQNGEAAEILRDLAARFPGDPQYISDLFIVQDSVISLSDFPVTGYEVQHDFTRFGYEIGGKEFLEGLRLPAAAMEAEIGEEVVLLRRKTLLLDGLDAYRQRLRCVTQIRTELGAERNRTQVFPFDPENGVPRVLVARVLAPDGELLEVPPSQILIRAPRDEESDVTDRRELVVPLGSVSPGAVIDIAYETGSGLPLLSGFSTHFLFPEGSPVKTSIVELWHAENLPLTVLKTGEGIEDTTDPATRVRRLVMHDLKPIEEVPNAGNLLDVFPHVGLTTNTSWDDVAGYYGTLFWPLAEPGAKVQARARALTAAAASREEKVETLFRFIRDEIDGLAVELGSGRYVPTPPEEVLDRRWGDCKDLSCLLISLLAAVDIEARPVLVAAGDAALPRTDFPSLFVFNHMIVQVTGVSDDFYCDPLNGRGCADNLPVTSGGKLGLHLARDGSFELAGVTPRHANDHGFDILTDVYPQTGGHLRYEVTGTYRGGPADYMRPFFAFGDSGAIRWLLGTSLGYGLPRQAEMQDWRVQDTGCDRFAVSATFLDTTWTQPAASQGMVICSTEAADYWGLPAVEGRQHDVILHSPYDNRFVLRLHETEVWKPGDEISGYKAENDLYRASFKRNRGRDGDDRYVELVEEFQLKTDRIPCASYAEVMDAAIRFKLHAARAYTYRKVFDEKQLDDIRRYVKENPDDLGFLGNAAMHVLGTDMGGSGEEGRARREFARGLILPLGDQLTDYPMLALLTATTLLMDGRWTAADSLGLAALAKNPASTELLNIMASVKQELEQYEEQAALLKKLNNLQGSQETAFELIVCSLTLGDEDEARKQMNRLELMGAPIDPTILLLLRLQAAYHAYDYPRAAQILTQLDGKVEPERFELMRADNLLQSHRYQESLEPYEASWREAPTSPIHCNNLAWIYAMLGVKLDLAYDLAEAASVMSLDSTSSRHTMGTILARQQKWEEAERLFGKAFRENDKPSDRMVNGLFYGLCRYSRGDREEARRIWDLLDGLVKEAYWVDALQECRRRDEAGLDPWGAVFPDLALTEGR